jgi:hypothetical protein
MRARFERRQVGQISACLLLTSASGEKIKTRQAEQAAEKVAQALCLCAFCDRLLWWKR